MNSSQDLHSLCIEKNISLSTAESCTSGALASAFTSISGSSSFFRGGLVAYQNEIKIKCLGVPESIIKERTVVCSDVAEKMAENVRLKFSSDFSISTTGYAGPLGGTDSNPVGTVFIAVSSKKRSVSKRFFFKGDRASIISQAVVSSISFLYSELKSYK